MKYLFFISLTFESSKKCIIMQSFKLLCEEFGSTKYNEKWEQYFEDNKSLQTLLLSLYKIENPLYHVMIEEEEDVGYYKGRRTSYVSRLHVYIWTKDGVYTCTQTCVDHPARYTKTITANCGKTNLIKYDEFKDPEFLEGLTYGVSDTDVCLSRLKKLGYVTI